MTLFLSKMSEVAGVTELQDGVVPLQQDEELRLLIPGPAGRGSFPHSDLCRYK